MMVTLNLAVRNLLRNRRRSIATLLAMAIGSSSILLFGGYSTNINYTMHTEYVQTGGHLQVQHRDFYQYGSGNPTAYGISDYKKVIAAIEADEVLKKMVLVVTPTLQFGGIGGNYAENVSRTIVGIGSVAEDINRMRKWNAFDLQLASTRFALEGTASDAAIVGMGVARVLQLCDTLKISNCPKPEQEKTPEGKALPDDIAKLSQEETPSDGAAATTPGRIEVLAGNSRGTPNVASMLVVKAEPQGFKEFDEVAVLMHLVQAQQLIYGKSEPRVTSIVIQLRRSDQIPVATARLGTLLAGFSATQPLAVLDFQTLNPFYVQTIQLFDTIFGFIFALIGAIVLFTVGNTMNTAVVERTVEIGTLRAIGLRRAGIRNLFVSEGALLGLAGGVLGVALALTLATVSNSLGFTWTPPGSAVPLPLTLTVWGETKMIAGTSAALICIAVVSAWWPSYRAARLNVVDALRHV
jgi:putative ABC transport system permease protein